MSNPFFERPIVNSPYEYPRQHWELDESGQPTGNLVERRRRAEFITPIPKPKKRRGSAKQEELLLDEGRGLTTKKQAYDLTSVINEVRSQVDTWRHLPASQWQVLRSKRAASRSRGSMRWRRSVGASPSNPRSPVSRWRAGWNGSRTPATGCMLSTCGYLTSIWPSPEWQNGYVPADTTCPSTLYAEGTRADATTSLRYIDGWPTAGASTTPHRSTALSSWQRAEQAWRLEFVCHELGRLLQRDSTMSSTEPTITELFDDGSAIDEALREAARDARRLHKALGNPMATWQDGQVVWVQPEDIVVDIPVEASESSDDSEL